MMQLLVIFYDVIFYYVIFTSHGWIYVLSSLEKKKAWLFLTGSFNIYQDSKWKQLLVKIKHVHESEICGFKSEEEEDSFEKRKQKLDDVHCLH